MKTKSNVFELKESLDSRGFKQFWFVVKARNGKTIAVSETYKSKQGRKRGAIALHKRLWEIKLSKDLQEFK